MPGGTNKRRRPGGGPEMPILGGPEGCRPLDAATLVSSERHDDVAISGQVPGERTIASLTLCASYVVGVVARGCKFPGLNARDCVFRSCDFSNADWTCARLKRCRVESCRLTGLWGAELTLEDVCLVDCTLDLAVLQRCMLAPATFEQCALREVDLQFADLRRGVFRGCSFKGTHLELAMLDGADLRQSDLSGIVADAESLRGAIVEPIQAMDLLHIFGLDVRDAGDLAE